MIQVVLTGSEGQLGCELQRCVPDHYTLVAVDHEDLDITDVNRVNTFLSTQQPDIVINAAAYTAVDKAEKEAELAYAVNHKGAENLAQVCQQRSIRMVQVSTDFVFSGKHYRPYLPEDSTAPASVYGLSKQAGDRAVLEILGDQALVVRTSWLYAAQGHNFVKTMLKLMQEHDSLNIIYDQVGSPTWAATLAKSIWQLLDKRAQGIYHCADNGVASWYDFAVAIQEEAVQLGLLTNRPTLVPIRTEQYPTPAARPAYSVMDKAKTEQLLQQILPHWRESLRNMLLELTELK